MEKITEFINLVVGFLSDFGIIGGFLLIMIESIIPILPLGVFIGLNVMAYGNILGFVISYFATVVGCMLSFTLFRLLFNNFFHKIFKEKTIKRIEKLMNKMTNIDFNTLVIFIAMPFTPAFLINIAAGLSGLKWKKFLVAIFIGKISIIYFWGYVGKSLLESFTDPLTILKIVGIVFLAYLISKVIEKVIKVEE